MVRKGLLGWLILSLFLISTVQAQSLPPPPGVFIALADLSTRLGQTFTLICTDPADGATCHMSDARLNWSWRQIDAPDTSLGCATFFNVATVPTRGYVFTFTLEGRVYDYRQYVGTGDIFLCTTQGAEFVRLPRPASACPIPPQLSIGTQARVRPGNSANNNIRANPDRDSPLLGEIPPGGVMDVLSGPACVDNFIWWEIRYGTLQGWTVEGGSTGEYFLETVDGTTASPTGPRTTAPSRVTAAEATSLTVAWSMPLPSFPFDMSYSPAQGWMAVVDANGLAVYQALGDGVPLLIERNAAQQVDRAAFSPDGTRLAAAQSLDSAIGQIESSIWVWNTRPIQPTGIAQAFPRAETAPLPLPNPIEGKVIKLEFNYDGSLLAYATEDSLVVQGINAPITFSVNALPSIENFALSPTANLMAVAKGNNVVEVWDLNSQTLRGSLPVNPDVITQGLGSALAFSPDGTQLAYVSNANLITVVDVTSLGTDHTLSIANSSPSVIQNVLFGSDLLIVSTLIPQLDSFDYLFDLRTDTLILRQLGGDGSQAMVGSDGTLHWLIPSASGVVWAVYQ